MHRRIRLRIDANAPEFNELPWELLREVRSNHAALNLAADASTPFSRYIAGSWLPGSPVFERPLKILVVIPAPTNLAEIDLPNFDSAQEWSHLKNAMTSLEVQLMPLPSPCTMSALQSELRKGYHVLHIVTHGFFNEDQSVIVLEDENHQSILVGENEFAEMVSRLASEGKDGTNIQPRLVYLDSCESAKRDNRDAFRGFAPALVKAGIPAVIAMQELVSVPTSQAFATAFYRQLLTEGQVDLACNYARSTLMAGRVPGSAIPVLFMRLADGVLLGKQGRISGQRSNRFWPYLIDNIEAQQCVPIVGPNITSGLLPAVASVAEKLSQEFDYPLADANNMRSVAQFIQLDNPQSVVRNFNKIVREYIQTNFAGNRSDDERNSLRSASLPDLVQKLEWSVQIQKLQENEIHHVLAKVALPLYLTTNFDNFMIEALRANGCAKPRQEGIRWTPTPDSGSPEWALLPEPSAKEPIVFHLNGFLGDKIQEENMVFSEEDYLQHFARITKQRDQIFPANILGTLAQSSFILLGFETDSWEFRLVIQGLLPAIAQIINNPKTKKRHIGIQLDSAHQINGDKVDDYLTRFLDRFDIDVYWGSPKQFANELHERWYQHLADSNHLRK